MNACVGHMFDRMRERVMWGVSVREGWFKYRVIGKTGRGRGLSSLVGKWEVRN